MTRFNTPPPMISNLGFSKSVEQHTHAYLYTHERINCAFSNISSRSSCDRPIPRSLHSAPRCRETNTRKSPQGCVCYLIVGVIGRMVSAIATSVELGIWIEERMQDPEVCLHSLENTQTKGQIPPTPSQNETKTRSTATYPKRNCTHVSTCLHMH